MTAIVVGAGYAQRVACRLCGDVGWVLEGLADDFDPIELVAVVCCPMPECERAGRAAVLATPEGDVVLEPDDSHGD